MNEPTTEAHCFSSKNRKSLIESTHCGCFYCLSIFSPREVVDWCDNEETALCPFCGIDSIIGNRSEFPITKKFLQEMHDVWF